MLPERIKQLRAQCQPQERMVANLKWTLIDTGAASSDATPLLLLPGALGTAESFYKQVLPLHAQMRVISANYPAISDPGLIVHSLEQLLAQLEIPQVYLFGTSLGGYIAQKFYETHPLSVRKLIIGNSFIQAQRILATPLFNPVNANTLSALDLLALWRQRIEANVASNGSSELSDMLLAFLRQPDNAGQLQARLLTLANACQPITLKADPIAIIDCEDDAIIDMDSRLELRRCYPNARIYSLSQGGHYPYILNTERFNEIIGVETRP